MQQICAETSRPGLGEGARQEPASSVVGTEQDLISNAREMVETLTFYIQSSAIAADESKMERLLGLCDQLNGGIDQLAMRASRRARVHGLGLKVDGLIGSGMGVSAVGGETTTQEEGEVLLTPRVDKGKGRAQPVPEEPEKVLSPTFMITESEDEDEDERRYLDVEESAEEGGGMQTGSPTDRCVRFFTGLCSTIGADADIDGRSKSWVEEEGEIFRKGAVLLGPEEMEGEYAGEDLRREVRFVPIPAPGLRLFSVLPSTPSHSRSFSRRWSNVLHREASLMTLVE